MYSQNTKISNNELVNIYFVYVVVLQGSIVGSSFFIFDRLSQFFLLLLINIIGLILQHIFYDKWRIRQIDFSENNSKFLNNYFTITNFINVFCDI